MGIFDVRRLYTLAVDPITEKKDPGSNRGASQGATRAFVAWMEAVNDALLELLLEDAFEIDDAFLEAQGFEKNADGVWVLSDLDFTGADVIRFNTVCDVILTGALAGRPSQQVDVLALGLGQVDITNADALSQPANQIITTPRSQISLAPGVGFARLYYDGVSSLWRVIIHEQGAPLTPRDEFLLEAFSADGGTWTIDRSQVSVYTYYLKGAMLHISLRILGSSVSGPADRLRVALPLDYVAKKHMANLGFLRDDQGPLNGKATIWQSDFSSRDFNIEQMNGEGIAGGAVDLLGQFWIEIGTQGGELGTGPSGGGAPGAFPPVLPPSAGVPLPNALSTVQTVATENPTRLLESCQSSGGNWNFMDALVERLRQSDERWGFNGRRGDIDALSEDALAYYYGPLPPLVGSPNVYVVDVIDCHCPEQAGGSCTPTAAFNDVTDYSGAGLGAWVYPRGARPIEDETPNPGNPGPITGVDFLDANVSGWPQTSTINSVRVTSSSISFPHSKAGSWPTSTLSSGVVVEGNVWIVAFVNGQWRAATWEFLRPGQTSKRLTAHQFPDHINENPMSNYRPVLGETVGLMVSTRARGGQTGFGDERSNIVAVVWPY